MAGGNILEFLSGNIDPDGSLPVSDEYRAYNAVKGFIPREVINHGKAYLQGMIHTNTIEGFWALLKRAW